VEHPAAVTEDFSLTSADKMSSLWMRLRAHLEDRLADARRRNDAALSDLDTAVLRGEIKSLKRLIALGDDRPVLTGDEQPPI
jgi:hypothetical protein